MYLFNNKKLIITLCLIIAFTIVFNIGVKAYADFVIGGLAIKFVATVLASMGLLAFVNSQSNGVEGFTNGFSNYMEKVKGVTNVFGMIYTTVSNSIRTSTKMRLGSLANDIKDYYNSIKEDMINDNSWYEQIADVKGYWYYSNSGLFTEWSNSMYNIGQIAKIDIGNNYFLNIRGYSHPGNRNALETRIFADIYYNDTLVSGTNTSIDIPSSYSAMLESKVQLMFQVTNDSLILEAELVDMPNNSITHYKEVKELPILVGLVDVPSLEMPYEYDFPIPQTVPENLPFPWQLEGDISGNIGKTIEEIIEGINTIDIPGYIEKLLEIPKRILDSYPIPKVIVGEDGVVTDIDVPEVDVVTPEIIEQTGLLSSILAILVNIRDLIKDMVLPKDIEELDFAPLKNIAVTDRFPFSLPWDLKNSISLLVAPPKAPVFNVPMVTEEIVLDLNQFETLAKISRSMLSIIFVVSLIVVTRRFIGGA